MPLHVCLLKVNNPNHRYEIARLLVINGADVNAKNADNKKPLDLAITNKSNFYDHEESVIINIILIIISIINYFFIVKELLRSKGATN